MIQSECAFKNVNLNPDCSLDVFQSLSKELHLDGGMLAGCKFTVMNFCLMNKEKALRTMLLSLIFYAFKRYRTKKYRRL